MGKTDWSSISLPTSLMEELDLILESDISKKLGVSSRAQIITIIIRNFIDRGFESLKEGNSKDPLIHKLEKKFQEMEDRLEKHEQLFKLYRLNRYMSIGSHEDTQTLHGENGMELIKKIDPPNSPHKITTFDTFNQRKRMKDNLISGLITVQIRKNKMYCSHDIHNDSCDHIRYALDHDPEFVKLALMKNVKNSILKEIIEKK